jgi:hypothetical protein
MSDNKPVIGTAVQRGATIFVYDERGRHLSNIQARDGLQSYTGNTVSVRSGSMIFVFDGRGHHLSTVLAR